jgi:hypothetical protein
MLAAIIGNGGDDSDHLEWGWYVFDGGDYRSLARQELRERIRIDPQASLRLGMQMRIVSNS